MGTDEWKERHLAGCQSDDHRAKLSESSKQNWEDAEYRDQMTSKIREFVKTEQYSEKQSEQSKRKWQEEEYRQKQSAGAERKNTPEFRQKISGIVKEYWTDERRGDVAETVKELWTDDEYRYKTVMASKSAMADPAVSQAIADRVRRYFSDQVNRQHLSEVMLALWSDPEYREQMGELLSSNSRKLWENQDYRQRVVSAVTATTRRIWGNPELSMCLRKACGERSSELWADLEYRRITIDALTERMKEVWADPEYRDQMAKMCGELSRRRWADPEYRDRMIKISSESSRRRWADPEYREKMAEVRAKQLGRVSSIQRQLYKYLTDLNVDFVEEGPDTRIGYYVFDCLIPKRDGMIKSLLVECQGDYWHSSPKAQHNDRSKFTYIDRYFPDYEIMYVWEHEFYAKDRVLDRLKLKLGVDIITTDFDFNNIDFKEVSGSDVKEFLDAYHYIGKGRGGRCFGAFLNNNLIACVVFSSPLRQNTAGQFGLVDGEVRELSRFCIHPSYHKRNFASWLIARSIKSLVECKLVVAYADRTVGHTGAIYKASNFSLHHIVPADYWYVDGDGFVMHKRTLYGRARQMKMTESEYAINYGYFKKFGGEKLCFINN